MKFSIELNEGAITTKVEEEIIEQIISENFHGINNYARTAVKKGIEKAVKEYIYVNKDKIIEKVVDRATAEIVRKGIPRLLERV